MLVATSRPGQPDLGDRRIRQNRTHRSGDEDSAAFAGLKLKRTAASFIVAWG